MENRENINQDQKMQGKETDTRKKDFRIFQIAIIVLILIIGVLAVLLINTRQTMQEIDKDRYTNMVRNIELEKELDSLMYEYSIFKYQHDSILHDKDSVIQQNAREIERLIAQQEDSRRIRRQLDYLRQNYQDYVVRIDSLYRVAEVLRIERDEALEEVAHVREYALDLERDREALSTKVEVASALRARHINTKGFRTRGFSGREVEDDRASRVDYLRVCFSIAENPIAPTGNQNVYVRIAGPDDEIFRISDDDAYSFVYNQDTLQFTLKEQINYQNREKEVCLIWDRTREYLEGIYLVSVFTDEELVGESSFTLR